MWLHIQTWLPLVTVSLTAAICFDVASFILGSARVVASGPEAEIRGSP
jgi:hypothetical protein